MLKKGAFQWNYTAEQAFNSLKEEISCTPVLAIPNFKQTFTLETYACHSRIGVVLMQGGHPIAYLTKTLISPRHLGWSTIEKEMYAILFAVQRTLLVWIPLCY